MSRFEERREAFVREYLKDFNATQAAIRAGYSEKTARQQASELLARPDIQARLKEFRERAAEQTQTDINWVRRRLKEEAELYDETATQSARVRAIELIAKLNGDFERHNHQKTEPLAEVIGALSGSVLKPRADDFEGDDE